MSFPCSKPSIDAQCPQTKTKLQRLQKEALHDPDPVTPLAFAQDLLWGTPTSPWRPAPHPLPREPSWTSPATVLDFSSTSLLPSGHSSKITTSYTACFLPTLQPLAHCLSSWILCPSTQISSSSKASYPPVSRPLHRLFFLPGMPFCSLLHMPLVSGIAQAKSDVISGIPTPWGWVCFPH